MRGKFIQPWVGLGQRNLQRGGLSARLCRVKWGEGPSKGRKLIQHKGMNDNAVSSEEPPQYIALSI